MYEPYIDVEPSLFNFKHPLRWIRYVFRNRKWKRQRIERGFSDADMWEMDEWFADVIPKMLECMADQGSSYDPDYKSREVWADKLREVARLIRDYRQEERERPGRNIFRTRWERAIYSDPQIKDEELCKRFWEEEKRIQRESYQNLKNGLSMLGQIYPHLWD